MKMSGKSKYFLEHYRCNYRLLLHARAECWKKQLPVDIAQAHDMHMKNE